MPYFVVDKWTSDLNGYLSFQYIINSEKSIDLEKIFYDDFWLIRENNGILFPFARLSQCHLFSKDEDDIKRTIIEGDPLYSEYFTRHSDDPIDLREILNIPDPSFGTVSSITIEKIEKIYRIIERSDRNRTAPKNEQKVMILEKIDIGSFDTLEENIRDLKKKYTRNELFRFDEDPKDWSPFASVVFHHFSIKKKGFPDLATLKQTLPRILNPDSQENKSKTRCIDLNLTPIIPEKITTRSFKIPPQTSLSSQLHVTQLMDRAEAEHQSILRDVCNYLIQNTHMPLESRSLDLYIESKDVQIIFEIKSSNTDNFHTQTLKGISQLQEYSYALEQRQNLKVNKKCLIINHCLDNEQVQYCKGLSDYMGIILLPYHANLEWPDRVKGLLELVKTKSEIDGE